MDIQNINIFMRYSNENLKDKTNINIYNIKICQLRLIY